MFRAKRIPELLVGHNLFVVGAPMGIDAVPPIPLEYVIANRTDAGSVSRRLVLASNACSRTEHYFRRLRETIKRGLRRLFRHAGNLP